MLPARKVPEISTRFLISLQMKLLILETDVLIQHTHTRTHYTNNKPIAEFQSRQEVNKERRGASRTELTEFISGSNFRASNIDRK